MISDKAETATTNEKRKLRILWNKFSIAVPMGSTVAWFWPNEMVRASTYGQAFGFDISEVRYFLVSLAIKFRKHRKTIW